MMSRRLSLIGLAVAGLMSSAVAVAAEPPYAGISYTEATYDEIGVPHFYPELLTLRLGQHVLPNVAVEGRFGLNLSSDRKNVSGTPVDVAVDHYFGAYVRGLLPVSRDFSIYGLLGYTQGRVTASTPSSSASDTSGGLSVGIGADVALTSRATFNIEYADLFDGPGYRVNSLNLGVAFKF